MMARGHRKEEKRKEAPSWLLGRGLRRRLALRFDGHPSPHTAPIVGPVVISSGGVGVLVARSAAADR